MPLGLKDVLIMVGLIIDLLGTVYWKSWVILTIKSFRRNLYTQTTY